MNELSKTGTELSFTLYQKGGGERKVEGGGKKEVGGRGRKE